ncbi:lytic polysaccharide monooxygenase [Nonomuraea longicatena]|uniref:Lytic polysaccharide monooxygenase n=1 Tax=Nonomuraea longicatena TaxID=83682 RepID=A0ABN1PGD7_9ACTN
MRRVLVLLSALIVAIGTTIFVASPAMAHGYINSPPSRQANCAQGKVSNCGPIIWEPQSVEGPKGQSNCHGGDSRWAPLSDESKAWPVASVGNSVTFNWTITARHATLNWEYYVGGTRVAVFSGNNQQPPSSLSHTVNLSGFSGRQKVLSVWNIADTPMAFYSCVDVQIGGGGNNPNPNPTPTPTPTDPGPGGTWAANTAYAVGSTVTYGGASYRCTQPHTSLPGWEPPNAPSLWQRA